MTDLIHLLISQRLKLAPFFNFVIIYFIFVHETHGELWTTILKCAPIVCLMLYIYFKGFALTKDFKYSQRILLGLIFSCAGDVLLNIDLFPHGMGAFAVAQIFYISAFGWKPLKLLIGIALYLAGATIVAVVFKSLDAVLKIGLPVYATLLLTMCWRSLAQAVYKNNSLSTFCAFGSVLFVISDGLICCDMFVVSVPYSRIWIMATYYLAQFAITLSTSTERSIEKKTSPKRSKRSVQTRISAAENVRQRRGVP